MAQKRMFDLAIVRSDKFLDMSPTAQLLYFHLGMNADDDGFVSPKLIMRMLGTPIDDLKILIVKDFVIPFEDGVVVIKDWKINNTIKNDRYKPTIYKDHLTRLGTSDTNSYIATWIQDGSIVDPKRIPSIVEISIVKESIEKSTNTPAKRESDIEKVERIKHYLENVPMEDIQEFVETYRVTVRELRKKIEKYANWYATKVFAIQKKYTNPKRMLQGVLLEEFGKRKKDDYPPVYDIQIVEEPNKADPNDPNLYKENRR